MTGSWRGVLPLLMGAVLAGCVAPMSAREARDIAHTRLDKYCHGRCGALAWSNTQKIKDRWLVDFEAPQQRFTVIVEDDGNSKVTVWNK